MFGRLVSWYVTQCNPCPIQAHRFVPGGILKTELANTSYKTPSNPPAISNFKFVVPFDTADTTTLVIQILLLVTQPDTFVPCALRYPGPVIARKLGMTSGDEGAEPIRLPLFRGLR